MAHLHSFTFYINTSIDIRDLSDHFSREHIQQTLVNIGQENATTVVNSRSTYTIACSILSVPLTFDYFHDLGNIFPNFVFNYVNIFTCGR
jgi:hypothetical protein